MIYILLLTTFLIGHLLILLNLQFTAWPEIFSYPFLLNNGFKPYLDVAFPYEPLLPWILAKVYQIFGYDLLILKITTWLIILLSDILIFLISYKIIGRKLTVFLPLVLYIITQSLLDGNMLWFDLACIPFILLAIFSFLNLAGFKKLFFLGLNLSLAFFIKQQIGLAILLVAVFLIFKYKTKIYPFVLGLVIPAIFVIIYILLGGITIDYFFWTKIVPLYWYPKFPGYINLPTSEQLIQSLLLFAPAILLLAFKSKGKLSADLLLVLLIFLALFVTAFPRFDYFRMQPALAVYMVIIIYQISRNKLIIVSTFLLVSLSLIAGQAQNSYKGTRFYSPADIELAKIINKTSEGKIYLLGPHSLLYIIADRLPPKPWVDNFVWYMEIPQVQETVISGWNIDPPEKIYWKIPQNGEWYQLGTYQPRILVDYIKKKYEKIENIADIEIWRRKK